MIAAVSGLIAGVLVFTMFWFVLLDGGGDLSFLGASIITSLIMALIVWLDVEGRIEDAE